MSGQSHTETLVNKASLLYNDKTVEKQATQLNLDEIIAKYCPIVSFRVKKSLGKVHDITCVIGRREDYRKYPRGTYPNLLFFCVAEGEFDHREPDLPPEGLETIEGPRLYNFADLPSAIIAQIKELSAPLKGLR